MSEFWLWMKDKKYGNHEMNHYILQNINGRDIIPTKQMMIGFMIEYLGTIEKGNRVMTIPYDELYEFLEKEINEYAK